MTVNPEPMDRNHLASASAKILVTAADQVYGLSYDDLQGVVEIDGEQLTQLTDTLIQQGVEYQLISLAELLTETNQTASKFDQAGGLLLLMDCHLGRYAIKVDGLLRFAKLPIQPLNESTERAPHRATWA